MTGLSAVLAAADPGPLLEAVLVPVSGQGKLRVTYNWLYSSLNCDPGDTSDFIWVLAKVSDTQVSLSPRDPYAGRRVYASVRDDANWFVQVQAPGSADWITAVGRDEQLTITGGDLLTVSLQGFGGSYLAVGPAGTSHDGHTGYRIQSLGPAPDPARTFFLGVTATRQAVAAAVPPRGELTDTRIAAALTRTGQVGDQQTIQRLKAALS